MLRLLCLAGLLTAAATSLAADPVEQGFPFEVAAPRANWEWDQDDRFEELIEQLAINEASLEAIDVAIARKTRSSRSRQSSARRFDDNNRLMDRKGGGPMNWREFYGTNAEKFFYHPVDPSTTYYTRTYLQQAGKDEDDKSGSDIPTRQSLPVHQRPPQWDYIYRANRTAREQALADAATLQSEVAQLEERRLLLEQEQAELWCRLAFRAVRRHDMHRKPVVRFAVRPAGTTPDALDQAEAIAAAAAFFSTALQVVMKADEDQPVALTTAQYLIVNGWYDLDDAMLGKDTLNNSLNDIESPLGQFMRLAKMLSDKGRTLTESFEGTRDTITQQDSIRRDRYRGMLQRTVVDYAQIILGLEELLDVMQQDWEVTVDNTKQITFAEPTWKDAPPPLEISSKPAPTPRPRPSKSREKPEPPRPQNYYFAKENAIRQHWHLNAQDDTWSIENNSLKFSSAARQFCHGAIKFRYRLKGNAGIALSGFMNKSSFVTVHAFGERFIAEPGRDPQRLQIQITQRGDQVQANINGRVTLTTLKESRVGLPSDLTVSWGVKNTGGGECWINQVTVLADEVVPSGL